MIIFGIFLITFGVIIIMLPEIIAYMIGGFLVFLGLNIIISKYIFTKKNKTGDSYVSFGKYKIYKE